MADLQSDAYRSWSLRNDEHQGFRAAQLQGVSSTQGAMTEHWEGVHVSEDSLRRRPWSPEQLEPSTLPLVWGLPARVSSPEHLLPIPTPPSLSPLLPGRGWKWPLSPMDQTSWLISDEQEKTVIVCILIPHSPLLPLVPLGLRLQWEA